MRKLVLLCLGVVLAGCGGGSGSGGQEPAPKPESTFGDFSFRAAATNPPVTTNSFDVTATGIKGNFSMIRLRDRLTSLDETKIYFEGVILTRNWEIYSINADGTNLKQLTFDGMENHYPDVSPKGDKIAFASGRDGNFEIYTMFTDGTGLTRITNNASPDVDPAWSPDGNKLVFTTSRYGEGEDLAIVDLNTKVVTRLTSGAWADRNPDWSPDGKTIIFSSSFNAGWFNLYTVPATGGGTSTFHLPVSEARHAPIYSPDGIRVAYVSQNNLYRTPARGFGVNVLLGTGVSPSLNYVSAWSPDSTQIVLGDGPPGTNAGMTRYNAQTGAVAGFVIPEGIGAVAHPSWGPLIVDRTIVTSTGGFFGTRASGLIFTQGGAGGNSTRSVLTFDATTPSSVVLTQQTGVNNGGPSLVFSVDADAITYMTYANANDWIPARVIGNGQLPSAAGALVSFSSSTGYLSLVVPFNGSRGTGGRPTVTQEGGKAVFQGSFPAVFDAAGKNLAPNGASEVKISASGDIQVAP